MHYSIRDFLQAQLAAHAYRHAHPHLQTYFTQKAHAFRAAFRMSLDPSEGDAAKRLLASTYSPLLASALDSYVAIQTPFTGYLEVPRRWMAMIEQFEPAFAQHVAQMQELHQRFMLTLLENWYGPLTTNVTSTDLLQHGFDDTVTPPDPTDYM
jgi:hypothetical protein